MLQSNIQYIHQSIPITIQSALTIKHAQFKYLWNCTWSQRSSDCSEVCSKTWLRILPWNLTKVTVFQNNCLTDSLIHGLTQQEKIYKCSGSCNSNNSSNYKMHLCRCKAEVPTCLLFALKLACSPKLRSLARIRSLWIHAISKYNKAEPCYSAGLICYMFSFAVPLFVGSFHHCCHCRLLFNVAAGTIMAATAQEYKVLSLL